MNRQLNLLAGLGLGAGLMYFFDPRLGRRRRSLVRDQCVKIANQLECGIGCAARDLRNRSVGLLAEIRGLFFVGTDDETLCERVRSQLGRLVSHPRAIRLFADQGHIVLSGPVLASEVGALVRQVGRIKGVRSVENLLDVHEDAGNLPDLQGGRRLPSRNFLTARWSPATQLIAGGIGCGLIGYGLLRQNSAACILGTAGLALVARSAMNPQSQPMPTPKSRPQTVHHEILIATV